ncbi:DarT ssDNA thymidine ADP-ribosyltransferase family protein [Acinetobacter baumannii]|nr:DarT ssDNA thymidine ADP-ribosyltransferase family protein [Acinetobacter baumannii]
MTLAYHFTHIDNLDSILKHGLLSTSEKTRMSINHENIANMDIQSTRSQIAINSELKLTIKSPFLSYKFDYHEFVPFYFSQKSPMLLSLSMQKNIDQERVIYFVINCERMLREKSNCFFTDQSVNRISDLPNLYTHEDNLDQLDWDAINNRSFSLDERTKHFKMAEFLVHKQVLIQDVVQIITYNNDHWPKEVRRIFQENGMNPPEISKSPYFYYSNSRPVFTANDAQWTYPCVIGPKTLYEFTNQVIAETIEARKQIQKYNFNSIENLLINLESNPDCIRELAETNNLLMRYGHHNSTVGTHSKRVFNNLEDIKEYDYLVERDRLLVKISAYLHDIGKGPCSRWNNRVMHEADLNHSLKSLPMLKRILSQEVELLTEDDIYKIFICVTYDDLVGEIIGKDRNKKQLFDLIKSKDILDLLFTIGKADLKDVNSSWLDDESSFDALYAEALQEIND